MNNKLRLMALGFSLSISSFLVNAAVTENVRVDTKSDTFINDGNMTANQKGNAGVANQTLALRAIKSAVVSNVRIISRNNLYVNSGKMIAEQNTSGGTANQTVALDAY